MSASDSSAPDDFYDRLAPVYHLVYDDWDASIRRQAQALDALIKAAPGPTARTVLDVSCGIGTQCLGLAALGYAVTGSDASRGAIERARREAAARGLTIELVAADMRDASAHRGRSFDVVLCADNSLPHLTTERDMLLALERMHALTREGGIAIVTLRDYDREPRGGSVMRPYGVRVFDGERRVVFQVWDWRGEHYDLSLYIVDDRGGPQCTGSVYRTTIYAVGVERVRALMQAAGLERVERHDDAFYQPVLIGHKRE